MMDSKSGTRIDNSLHYCVLFSNYGDPGRVVFVAYNFYSEGLGVLIGSKLTERHERSRCSLNLIVFY